MTRGASRRTLVRGAAWSVPVVAVAATAPAFAASPCAARFSYRLDWSPTAYTRSNARSASANVTAGSGSTAVGVTFVSLSSTTVNVPDSTRNLTVPSNTGAGTTADPVVANLGGRAGERGIMLYHASSTAGRANRQEVTVTFSRPVRNLAFFITDIDTITSPAYSDRVEVIGRNAGGGAVSFDYTNDGITGEGTEASPWLRAGNSNVNENSAGAQVSVDFTKPTPSSATDIKSLTLTYWNATGGTQYHRIFLGDLGFTATAC